MLHTRAEATADGGFHLRCLPPLHALALTELPRHLADDAPGVAEHLDRSPVPGDAEAAAEWDRHAAPELARLFLSARAIVEQDLAGLAAEEGVPVLFRLEIPPGHQEAWLSSLAAVRVLLAEVHAIGEAEFDAPLPEEIVTARDSSSLLIYLLGEIQGLLLEAGA